MGSPHGVCLAKQLYHVLGPLPPYSSPQLAETKELTMCGFQVYTTEVDDRGIDFVARYEQGPFIEVQVKSLRSTGYVFMQKDKFMLRKSLYLALGLLFEGQPPELYLIPSLVWEKPDAVFVSRDYVGLKSKPEWGLNLSKKHLSMLDPYRFEQTVNSLCQ
jgi:hypothetical protein